MLVFEPVEHRYFLDGLEIPSVTTVLKTAGLSPDYSGVPANVLKYKRIVGQAVHKTIELLDNDDLDRYSPAIEGYVRAWERFKSETHFTVLENERKVLSTKYRYAGTLDRFGMFNGKTYVLLDVKTTSLLYPQSVFPQLGGYEIAYREETGFKKPMERATVQLKADGSYKIHIRKPSDSQDLNVFLYAVQLYHWKEQWK